MSMSSVTIWGSSVRTWSIASRPSRAVPTTRNSPELSTSWEITWRMNALSSTTRTVGRLDDTATGLQGVHFDPSIGEVEVDTASVIATDVFSEQGDAGRRQGS